jgi:transcription initiation factor IIE alpha subunit
MTDQIQRRDQSGRPRRSWFMEMQGLDDAIAYRIDRLAEPCRDCDEAADRCDDHSCDADLVSGYRQRVAALLGQKPKAGWSGLRPSA